MVSEESASPKPLWRPGRFGDTYMDQFRRDINAKYDLHLDNYEQLYEWSVQCDSDFWAEFFSFSGLVHSSTYSEVVEAKPMNEIPVWFKGARLNYAENVLEKGNPDKVALYIANEGPEIREVTFGQLKSRVKQLSDALRAANVKPGDRVVGYMPNNQEALEAYLATAVLGAVWSTASPDFGASSLLERFQQINPKVLFSVDTVTYNGRTHNHLKKLSEVLSGLPELQLVVVCPNNETDESRDSLNNFLNKTQNSIHISKFLASTKTNGNTEIAYAQVAFDHPLCILYSSGTTGTPKCMVHSVGGTLIQHLKEHILHGNVSSDDIMFYYTTTGWMMYNWMVSALALGAAIVLYDGAPTPIKMWDIVDKIAVTIYGTSAKWIATSEQQGLVPRESHKLTALHTILSTGSPLSPQSFRYVYKHVKEDVMLGSISGGSDIISCFVGQNPTIPVYEGEIQSRNLGMAIECWDANGKQVFGEEGELVCTKAFPCMPVYFWNDNDGEKYRKAYFGKYKGVWAHGDFCVINPVTKGVVMLGRSDGTLNPNGVRFGSAEIYNVLQSFSQLADSLCVSQSNSNCDERVVLFLKLAEGHTFNQQLVDSVKFAIREQLSPRHVPALILPVGDIPYTLNGKKVEIAVKMILSGKDALNRACIVNPESLDLYKNIPEIEAFRNG